MPNNLDFSTSAQEAKKSWDSFEQLRKALEPAMKKQIIRYAQARMNLRNPSERAKMERILAKALRMGWRSCWTRIAHYDPEVYPDGPEWVKENVLTVFLVEYALDGNDSAFQLLLDKYYRALASFLSRNFTGRMGAMDFVVQKTNESVENAFQRAWRFLDKYSPYEASFFTWFQNLARNLFLNLESKEKRKASSSLDAMEDGFNGEDFSEFADSLLKDEVALPPDQDALHSILSNFLFENLFQFGGYPWQIACHVLILLQYKPEQIVEVFSTCSLRQMVEHVSEEFQKESNRSAEQIESFFEPVFASLDKPLGDIVKPTDSRTRKNLAQFLETDVGNLKLQTFFGKNPNKNVWDWIDRVNKNLKKIAFEQGLFGE